MKVVDVAVDVSHAVQKKPVKLRVRLGRGTRKCTLTKGQDLRHLGLQKDLMGLH